MWGRPGGWTGRGRRNVGMLGYIPYRIRFLEMAGFAPCGNTQENSARLQCLLSLVGLVLRSIGGRRGNTIPHNANNGGTSMSIGI